MISKKLKDTKSLVKKQNIINQEMNREFFYFNPLYKELVLKRTTLIDQTHEAVK